MAVVLDLAKTFVEKWTTMSRVLVLSGSEDLAYAQRESMSRPPSSALTNSPSRLMDARELMALRVKTRTWFQVSMAGISMVVLGHLPA